MPRSDRSAICQIAAFAKHANADAMESTAAARAAGPGTAEYWEAKVDPDQTLKVADRKRRAKAAKSEFYARLARESAKVRGANKARRENLARS